MPIHIPRNVFRETRSALRTLYSLEGHRELGRVILKTIPKCLTLVKLDERVRWPSQRSNVLLKIIHIIYLTYMCVTCVNHVMHSSNILDQILVRRLWRY
jgi:hypothetical protein